MSIAIDHTAACEILFSVAKDAHGPPASPLEATWREELEHLTKLCPFRRNSTVFAALGTAILAKCVDRRVDPFSNFDRAEAENSYSARSLADLVLARHRSELNLDLGANGPNPLNNSPFGSYGSYRDISGVRNRDCWERFMASLEKLDHVDSTADAKRILRAFICVRRRSILEIVTLDPGAGEHLPVDVLAVVVARRKGKGRLPGLQCDLPRHVFQADLARRAELDPMGPRARCQPGDSN